MSSTKKKQSKFHIVQYSCWRGPLKVLLKSFSFSFIPPTKFDPHFRKTKIWKHLKIFESANSMSHSKKINRKWRSASSLFLLPLSIILFQPISISTESCRTIRRTSWGWREQPRNEKLLWQTRTASARRRRRELSSVSFPTCAISENKPENPLEFRRSKTRRHRSPMSTPDLMIPRCVLLMSPESSFISVN